MATPNATDNCMSSVIVTNNIVNFPITSDTTITWTYTDAAKNTTTQTQEVVIDDATAPAPMGGRLTDIGGLLADHLPDCPHCPR
ncbi:MAG: hypothetical protein OXH57_06350 [Ekhidna sp.]|nr:hypothetical protein [Ekhidna sp.]